MKLYQTNVYGYGNVDEYPTGIRTVTADGLGASSSAASPSSSTSSHLSDAVFNLSGQIVGHGNPTDLSLPQGVYVYKGKRVVK